MQLLFLFVEFGKVGGGEKIFWILVDKFNTE